MDGAIKKEKKNAFIQWLCKKQKKEKKDSIRWVRPVLQGQVRDKRQTDAKYLTEDSWWGKKITVEDVEMTGNERALGGKMSEALNAASAMLGDVALLHIIALSGDEESTKPVVSVFFFICYFFMLIIVRFSRAWNDKFSFLKLTSGDHFEGFHVSRVFGFRCHGSQLAGYIWICSNSHLNFYINNRHQPINDNKRLILPNKIRLPKTCFFLLYHIWVFTFVLLLLVAISFSLALNYSEFPFCLTSHTKYQFFENLYCAFSL